MKKIFKSLLYGGILSSLLLLPAKTSGLEQTISNSETVKTKKIERVLSQFNNRKWTVNYKFLSFFQNSNCVESLTSYPGNGNARIEFKFLSENKNSKQKEQNKYIKTEFAANSGKPVWSEWNTVLGNGRALFSFPIKNIYYEETAVLPFPLSIFIKPFKKSFKLSDNQIVYDFPTAITSYLSENIEEGVKKIDVLFHGNISPYYIRAEKYGGEWKLTVSSEKSILGYVYFDENNFPTMATAKLPMADIEIYDKQFEIKAQK